MNKLKHLIYILILATVIQSCSESTTSQISGTLDELTTNRLILVYDDPKSKVDSIFITGNKFFYTFSPDTITLMRLVDNNGNYIPLFADKGWEIKIEGSFQNPQISGKGPNKDYQHFLDLIAGKSEDEVKQQVMNFVQQHPQSFASAYIINKYLIDIEHPDIETIYQAIQPLHGLIKDCRILSLHKGKIKETSNDDSRLAYYTFKDRNKKSIYLVANDYKYTLINFWASWDEESCIRRDSLYSITKDSKNKDLRIINYSLDYDKQSWESKCKKDASNWKEVCDFKAWEHTIIETHGINKLPSNILLDKQRSIVGRNLFGTELRDKIQELIAKENDK